MTQTTKPELYAYINWKSQAEYELKLAVQTNNHKYIQDSKDTLARLEENYKDVELGKFFNKTSFFYHNNGKSYQFPGRFTSDSEADRKCRIKYQGLFIQHYEMFSLLSESKDEEWLELQARFYSAREPHFTGFDGDAYRQTKEVK